MTFAGRGHGARWLKATAIAVMALFLGGCVFLRLLKLKHQLAEFDRYFTLETDHGLRLGCVKPILLTGDLQWLGITPASTRALGHAEQWTVRWVKQVPEEVVETSIYDVTIEMVFTEGRLSRVHIPERYFALFPKAFFIDLLQGMGSARIDRSARAAMVSLPEVTGGKPSSRITRDALVEMLGRPSEERREGSRRVLAYRFIPAPPGAGTLPFDLAFTFAPAGGSLVRLQGLSRLGRMSFNIAPAAPQE